MQHLKNFLQDETIMYAYEHAFSDEEVQNWLEWNLASYTANHFGLWAIILKETGGSNWRMWLNQTNR